MTKGDKYLQLKKFLENSTEPMVKLSFKQIETIIQNELPPSAQIHSEAWWSNNIDHSQAISWLHAGYETDMVAETYKDQKIIFIKRNKI